MENDLRRWMRLVEAVQPVLYHGTDDRFDAHRLQGTSYLGIYFSSDPNYARRYGKYLMAAHIRLTNPFNINMDDRTSPHYASTKGEIVIDGRMEGFYRKLTSEIIVLLREHGYDGIIAQYDGNPFFEVVALDPAQIQLLKQ